MIYTGIIDRKQPPSRLSLHERLGSPVPAVLYRSSAGIIENSYWSSCFAFLALLGWSRGLVAQLLSSVVIFSLHSNISSILVRGAHARQLWPAPENHCCRAHIPLPSTAETAIGIIKMCACMHMHVHCIYLTRLVKPYFVILAVMFLICCSDCARNAGQMGHLDGHYLGPGQA